MDDFLEKILLCDKKKFSMEVVYTYLWEKYSWSYFGTRFDALRYQALFVSNCAENVRKSTSLEIKKEFYNKMSKWCEFFKDETYVPLLKELDKEMAQLDKVERIFLQLATHFCILCPKDIEEVIRMSQDIAEYILSFMEQYFRRKYPKDDIVYTAFLRELRMDYLINCDNGKNVEQNK